MLLAASYIFYGSWDWRFLSLLALSTVIDYFCGIKIHESKDKKNRKLFVTISIISNLSILGFFKYFNFFASSLQDLLSLGGISVQPRFLNIILPLGISFYTFQTMSYTIDIYRKKMKPTGNFLDFALFVSFFLQLVAGPIERAKHLLPQIISPRKLNLEKFYEGAYLIFWGLFLKVFVADNLALLVDAIFVESSSYHGVTVLLGSYCFAFQIFGDFAGYSNIARGIGKCMGFDIMLNFNLPYFATNPRDFWRRWHISLSTWLRDYVYIPLGGNQNGTLLTYRNLILTMLLGGLWHGAAWTFILWGAYHGLLLIIYRLMKPVLQGLSLPSHFLIQKIGFAFRVIFFFHCVCLGWILFRAESLKQAYDMLYALIFKFDITQYIQMNVFYFKHIGFKIPFLRFLIIICFPMMIQSLQFIKRDLLIVLKGPVAVRGMLYIFIFYLISIFGVNDAQSFIYFQF